MMWGGIDQQLSSVADKPGVSEYQQNTRMTVAGELQRRPGMAPANFSPTGRAAIGMVGAFPTSGPYGVTVDTAGSISGFPITGPIWEPPKLKPPLPVGTAWVMNDTGAIFSGGTRYATTVGGGSIDGLSCYGQLNLSVDGGGFACSGTVTVYRERPTGGLLLVQNSVRTEADFNFVVLIPFNGDYSRIYVTILQLTGSFTLHASGFSDAACG